VIMFLRFDFLLVFLLNFHSLSFNMLVVLICLSSHSVQFLFILSLNIGRTYFLRRSLWLSDLNPFLFWLVSISLCTFIFNLLVRFKCLGSSNSNIYLWCSYLYLPDFYFILMTIMDNNRLPPTLLCFPFKLV
jgi:hypothetical protein